MNDRPLLHPPTVLPDGPLVHLRSDGSGVPIGATAAARIAAPPGRLWALVEEVEGYARRVPMIRQVRREGDRVTVALRFRVSFFSAGFEFVADAVYERDRWLELRWVSGEPRDFRLRFDVTPLDGGAASWLHVAVGFDIGSLGWLVKFFLRHHPEIQFGVYPGVALVMLDSIRRAALGEPAFR